MSVRPLIIEGEVAPGFESVRALYERNMRTLAERNTQLCIYVGEQCVVDLYASAVGDQAFSADSLVNVFSSGKSLESLTLAMLQDRGLIDYDRPIAEYWPEYGCEGKAETTVADLMRHEAGLAAFDETLDPEALHPHNLKRNTAGEVIARQSARFRAGSDQQREYHAITRGWIAGEVFRRVEPEGRTMGEFLRAEVSEPLGADVYIGLREDELSRISPVQLLGFGFQFVQGLIPRAFGRRMERNLLQTSSRLWQLRGAIGNRSRPKAPVPIVGMQKITAVDSPAFAMAEIPSAGAKCNARGLAKLAAAMANGGEFGGHRLMSAAAHEALHAKPVTRDMMALRTSFTQAGLAKFEPVAAGALPLDVGLNTGREGFYGWMGLGGSIFQWHPELRIGFAYVPTSLHVIDIVNERGKVYQAEVARCVEALGNSANH